MALLDSTRSNDLPDAHDDAFDAVRLDVRPHDLYELFHGGQQFSIREINGLTFSAAELAGAATGD